MRALIVACLGMLLLAPLAQAQFIDCSGGCSETLYGLGNDSPEGPFLGTFATNRIGPRDGSCGPPLEFNIQGQFRIREQNGCAVSATARCPVEMPQIALDSGLFNTNRGIIDLGTLGLVAALGGQFIDMGGNLGHRQLSGSCTLDQDQECALDADCPSGAGCLSSCFSSPGTPCAGHADCPAADCRTEIEWDGIGLCTDDTTVCTSDADCPGEHVCLAGLQQEIAAASRACCQSQIGSVCAIFGSPEYPALSDPSPIPPVLLGTPDWLFEGGRATPFDMETIQVPGQQEGSCNGNRSRPCGALGDFWAGAANGKCESGTPACVGDPFGDDPAIASSCVDVAFGGQDGDFCDLTENGFRFGNSPPPNPDGTPNFTRCAESVVRLIGTPGELCALPNDIPDGDPQPGCQLINIGVVSQPDLDCNGVDDTEQGRCMPVGGAFCSDPELCPPCGSDGECASGNCINGGDLCRFIGEANWFLDSNNDDIGDECQCGDGNGDGAITGVDIGAAAICANDPFAGEFCDATIVDATGDNATTAEDIGGIVAAVNGTIQTSDLNCVRNIDSTQ